MKKFVKLFKLMVDQADPETLVSLLKEKAKELKLV